MGSIQGTPHYGRRLIPVFIDEIAERDPDRVFSSIPRTSRLKDGYLDITFQAFARAINRTAGWLEDNFGRSSSFETLAYIGPSDLRYIIIALAATKIGYKTLFPSPRNSLEGQLNLLSATDCKFILTAPGYRVQQDVFDICGLRLTIVPELQDMLVERKVRQYKFENNFDKASKYPFLVLHTSGSTGLPKPIVIKHGTLPTVDAHHLMPPVECFEASFLFLRNKRVLSTFPPFHMAGVILSLALALYDALCVWAPSNRPISAALIDEILDSTTVNVLFLAPSLLEDLFQSAASMDKLAKLDSINFAGGPLSREVGAVISQKTRLFNTIGTTECCTLPTSQSGPEDWEYFHYNPELKGIEFRPITDGSDTFEQVFVRHPSTDSYHSTWLTFPELKEYPTKDLYTKHPTRPNRWLYVGRDDDIIVLSNGEKLNPLAMEATLRDHPSVKGALIVGQARFAPAAIIELRDSAAEEIQTPEQCAKFIEDIWPFAETANEEAPGHAQLTQDRMILSKAGKPFQRAAKGSVQRKATVKLYTEEIDEIYKRGDDESLKNLPIIDLRQDVVSLEIVLGRLIENVIGIQALVLDQDFFGAGMDSLHVMTIVKQLKVAVEGAPKDEINSRLIYTFPTVGALAAALKNMTATTNGWTNGTSSIASREEIMIDMLDSYSKKLPTATLTNPEKSSPGLTVVLTGSTGSLGSYLLDALLSSKSVRKVYCLNRRVDAEEQQAKTNKERGLVSKGGEQAVFLHADLSKPNLGLSIQAYNRLRDETSVIIHNQWPVNFNLSLLSFEPHITGTLNLIYLSSQSLLSPPIFFTSSIGTVSNWHVQSKHHDTPVPEIAIDNPSISLAQGYAESKWVTERLLDAAGKKSGVSSAVFRIGQIAGPVDRINAEGSAWNRQEWLPSIIQSSKYLGILPSTLGGTDVLAWTPVDHLADMLVELVENDCSTKTAPKDPWTRYYHFTNPQEAKWETLVSVIKDYFKDIKLKTVSFDEWVDRLEESEKENNVQAGKNPALKLMDLFQGMRKGGEMVRLDTRETLKRSEVMRGLKPVDGDWMRLWLEQWGF